MTAGERFLIQRRERPVAVLIVGMIPVPHGIRLRKRRCRA
ncbi:hypothetical protein EYB53_022765 [Candidatus Chloroploca sp. M-50]|uniref:Uncharacterized protein n=1 Tax=Candidatus Chloroploca mongolica TaxID=2528176 RepID=A0ABS4DGJ4_9CHLR|nr:hypothetical protein [Candidatus Chloroploca mongolica]